MMRMYRHVLAATAILLTPAALAAPCAGFTDVDGASLFCPSVEWIKNRSVTTGCTATEYCPSSPVSRLAMAAFMNRLGNALTPALLRVDDSPGAIDLDATPVVCQSQAVLVSGFPRQAVMDVTFAGHAPGDVDITADLVKSLDGGANWLPVSTVAGRGAIVSNRWGTLASVATTDLAVNDSVRFGVKVGRLTGAADLSDSRCNLRVAIGSRTGDASPY
ncbi:MAG TPA: hypothetical protein VF196_04800 [Casimicrobiaceae bacterium]